MKKIRIANLGIVLLVSIFAGQVWAAGRQTTIKGYVIDSACTFVKNLKKPVGTECAVACAKAGSPLVILANDGNLYWPISDEMPAQGQNDRLLPFAGEWVTVSGSVYEKSGSRAIVINTIRKASKP